LFDKNHKAWQASRENYKTFSVLHKQAEAQLLERKRAVFSEPLYKLDRLEAAFRHQEITLINFYKQLSSFGTQQRAEEYAALEGLARAEQVEAKLNLSVLSQEEERLARQVWKRNGEKGALGVLLKQREAAEGEAREQWRQALIYQALESGISLSDFPMLQVYQAYQKSLQAMRGGDLFFELEAFLQEIKNGLYLNEEQRELGRATRRLKVLGSIAQLKATRADLEWFELNRDQMPRDLLNALEPSLAFYRAAKQRDKVIAANARMIMEKTADSPLFIVVTGGFHSQGIQEIFGVEGISYLSVAPKIEGSLETSAYEKWMQGYVSDFEQLAKVSNYDVDRALLNENKAKVSWPDGRSLFYRFRMNTRLAELSPQKLLQQTIASVETAQTPFMKDAARPRTLQQENLLTALLKRDLPLFREAMGFKNGVASFEKDTWKNEFISHTFELLSNDQTERDAFLKQLAPFQSRALVEILKSDRESMHVNRLQAIERNKESLIRVLTNPAVSVDSIARHLREMARNTLALRLFLAERTVAFEFALMAKLVERFLLQPSAPVLQTALVKSAAAQSLGVSREAVIQKFRDNAEQPDGPLLARLNALMDNVLRVSGAGEIIYDHMQSIFESKGFRLYDQTRTFDTLERLASNGSTNPHYHISTLAKVLNSPAISQDNLDRVLAAVDGMALHTDWFTNSAIGYIQSFLEDERLVPNIDKILASLPLIAEGAKKQTDYTIRALPAYLVSPAISKVDIDDALQTYIALSGTLTSDDRTPVGSTELDQLKQIFESTLFADDLSTELIQLIKALARGNTESLYVGIALLTTFGRADYLSDLSLVQKKTWLDTIRKLLSRAQDPASIEAVLRHIGAMHTWFLIDKKQNLGALISDIMPQWARMASQRGGPVLADEMQTYFMRVSGDDVQSESYGAIALWEPLGTTTQAMSLGEVSPQVLEFRQQLEDWNQRYIRNGGLLGFQETKIDVFSGTGSVLEFDKLKDVFKLVYGDRVALSADSFTNDEDLERMLTHLRQEGLLMENEEEDLRESFSFHNRSIAVAQNTLGHGQRLTPESAPRFMKGWENVPFGAQQTLDELEAATRAFYKNYYRHADQTFFTITSLMMDLYKQLDPPEYEATEALDDFFIARKRKGMRFSLEKGFVIESTRNITVRENMRGDLVGFFEAHPESMFRAFEHAAHREMNVSGELRRAMVAARPALRAALDSDRSFLAKVWRPFSKRKSVLNLVNASFENMLRSPNNVAPLIWDMHRLGLLGIYLPDFERLRNVFTEKQVHRYSVDMHTMVTFDRLERLGATSDPHLQTARQLYRSVRKNPEEILRLRLGMLFHDVGKALSEPPFHQHADIGADVIVPGVLDMMGLADDNGRVNSIRLYVRKHMFMGAESKNVRREGQSQNAKLRAAAVFLKDSEIDPNRARGLYLITLADMFSVSPHQGMTELESDPAEVVPLPVAGAHAGIDPDDISTLTLLHETVMGFLADDSRSLDQILYMNEQELLQADREFMGELEGNVRVHLRIMPEDFNTRVTEAGRSSKDITEYVHDYLAGISIESMKPTDIGSQILQAFEVSHFGQLFSEYTQLQSVGYLMRLPVDTIVEQMILYQHMKLLRARGLETAIANYSPKEFKDKYETYFHVMIGSTHDKPGLLAAASGVLAAYGIDIQGAQINTARDGFAFNYFYGFSVVHPDNIPGSLRRFGHIILDRRSQ